MGHFVEKVQDSVSTRMQELTFNKCRKTREMLPTQQCGNSRCPSCRGGSEPLSSARAQHQLPQFKGFSQPVEAPWLGGVQLRGRFCSAGQEAREVWPTLFETSACTEVSLEVRGREVPFSSSVFTSCQPSQPCDTTGRMWLLLGESAHRGRAEFVCFPTAFLHQWLMAALRRRNCWGGMVGQPGPDLPGYRKPQPCSYPLIYCE